MKKIMSIIAILLFSILLVSCDKDNGGNGSSPSKDRVNVTRKESNVVGNTYTFTFTVVKSQQDNLVSISRSTATTIYNELKDEIGTKTVFLIITFEVEDEPILEVKYQVNRNSENLGLTLLNEKFLN